MINVMNHFQEKDRSTKLAEASRRRWFIAAREDKERKAQFEEQSEDAFLDLAASVIIATEIEIQTFQAKLNTYDEATVVALMENQELLDVVNERIADMLSRAHKLEDGRRVFKTEDGNRVYDEHGEQIAPTVIDPDMINGSLPKWEDYEPLHLEQKRLMQEREGLIQYQEKLDGAREHSNADDFTKEELDELEAELEADMPPAVAKHISGFETADNAPDLKSNFTSSSNTAELKKPVLTIEQAPTPL